MDKAILKQCFHNMLFVEEQEFGLVPFRYTKKQCAFYDTITYGIIMGDKARMSAGITLEFDTDATELTLVWQIAGGYPANTKDRGSSLDLFVDGTLMEQHMITCEWHETQHEVFSLRAGKKRVKVMLPHTYIFALEDIILNDGATLTSVPQREKKLLMMGDSITQGIGAQFACTGYAMQTGLGLDCECVNQSIAAVRFESEGLDNDGFTPDVITVALGTNDWSGWADRAEYDERAGRFMARMNELYPNVPVYYLSPVKRCRGEADREEMYAEAELKDVLARLCAAYPQMQVVDGWKLMPHTNAFFSDGLHPNDLGMTVYAHSVIDIIKEKL